MPLTRIAITDLEDRPEYVHCALFDPAEEWNGWTCPYFGVRGGRTHDRMITYNISYARSGHQESIQ